MAETCPWALTPGLLKDYHDQEWGVPLRKDRRIFEFLLLESAQAGLSWMTVLRKRDNYRQAFCGFDPEKVASFDKTRIDNLLRDPGIIRNRLKVQAAVNNARVFLEIASTHGSFSAFIWDYTDGEPLVNSYSSITDVPAETPLSRRISRDLKKLGFRFFGPVICYSHMQATGMVNDHMTFCFRHSQLDPSRNPSEPL